MARFHRAGPAARSDGSATSPPERAQISRQAVPWPPWPALATQRALPPKGFALSHVSMRRALALEPEAAWEWARQPVEEGWDIDTPRPSPSTLTASPHLPAYATSMPSCLRGGSAFRRCRGGAEGGLMVTSTHLLPG
jgi:hypothetical protein